MIRTLPIWKEFLCVLSVPALVSVVAIQGVAYGLPKPSLGITTPGKQSNDSVHLTTVHLTNSQPNTLQQFYATPSTVGTWQENLLSSDSLMSRESTQITLRSSRSSCYYDIKAIFSDGSQVSHYGLDFCDRTEYTF